jgi:predicted phage terminase large subunit-like protein
MALTQRDFEKQYGELVSRIQKQSTPFPNDTTKKREERKKRAMADKFFFAVTYFPHYIQVKEEYRACWKDPSGKYDWIDAGFAPCHREFFKLSDLRNTFSILAAFRESAKDTLIGKIDTMHQLLFEKRWFVVVVARTEEKAESKCVPIKIELETNLRLINDFGNQVGGVEWEFGSFITRGGRKMKGYGIQQSLRGEENFGHRPDFIMANDINDPTKPDSAGVVQKHLDSLKQDILKSVNSPSWSGVMLCNYTVKGDIVDEMLTGKNTAHFNKLIFRALVPNDLDSKADRAIALSCRAQDFPDGLKSAWEFRHPTLKLLQDRKDDPDVFEPEMMMMPRSRKDKKFKDSFFRYHTKPEIKGRPYVFYTFVDPSAKDASDYKAVVTVGLGLRPDGETLHIPIVRASIQQQSIDEMILETYRHRQAYNSKLVGVESNGFQILLKKEYMRLQKKHGLLPFKEVTHTGESKQSRVERIVPFIKEGTITFDQEDPDQELLIRQLKAFPDETQVAKGGIGDDGPDALAGCIELIEFFPNAGAVGYTSIQKRSAIFPRGAW